MVCKTVNQEKHYRAEKHDIFNKMTQKLYNRLQTLLFLLVMDMGLQIQTQTRQASVC